MYKLLLILLFLPLYLFSNTVITVTYPVQEYFIEKIALNKVYIRTVYESKNKFEKKDSRVVNKLSNSKFYFTFGMENEKELSKLFLSKNSYLKVVDITKGIKKIKLNNKENPYVWMDPLLVRKIAKNIYEQLIKVQREDRVFFKENLDKFLKELDELYLDMRSDILNSEVYGFLTYGDYWDYLAARFRLKVYKNKYKYLSIKEVPDFIRFARKKNLRKIIIKEDKSYEIAQSLAGHIGAKIIENNIFAHEWKSNIYMLARKLARKI
ncbi:MAG: metal ABC transporter solute-binding protein, Zn/Mn family [Halarcobacter sp.]